MQQRHQYLSLIMKRAWKAFKSGKGTHSQCLKASWKVYKTNKGKIPTVKNTVIGDDPFRNYRFKEQTGERYIHKQVDTSKLVTVDISALPVGKIKSAGVYNRVKMVEGKILDQSKMIQGGSFKFEANRNNRFAKIDPDSRTLSSFDYMGIRY